MERTTLIMPGRFEMSFNNVPTDSIMAAWWVRPSRKWNTRKSVKGSGPNFVYYCII